MYAQPLTTYVDNGGMRHSCLRVTGKSKINSSREASQIESVEQGGTRSSISANIREHRSSSIMWIYSGQCRRTTSGNPIEPGFIEEARIDGRRIRNDAQPQAGYRRRSPWTGAHRPHRSGGSDGCRRYGRPPPDRRRLSCLGGNDERRRSAWPGHQLGIEQVGRYRVRERHFPIAGTSTTRSRASATRMRLE